jgi:hypothetical protein
MYGMRNFLPLYAIGDTLRGNERRGIKMNETIGRNEAEVIKHSAAIQIHNNISLLQRKAWNVLLFHAYDELPTQHLHSIAVRELKAYIGYQSNDEEYLKEALRAMVGCQVEWNILKKDGTTQWGVSGLLASAVIENGICTYEYSSILRERLYNPTMYAKISLSLQNRFDGKHAQALWELCVDYLGSGRAAGETPYIPLEQFRKLMGVAENMYPHYKSFSQWVLRPALKEVNAVSDLQVTEDYQRKGRKVVAIKFKIRRVITLPVKTNQQLDFFPETRDTPIVHMLKEAGLAASDAWEVWQKGFEFVVEDKRPVLISGDREAALLAYVREKIDLLKQRQKEGKVQNASGFLLTALKQNFSHAEYEKKQASQQRADRVKQLRQLLKDREHLLEQQDNAIETLCNEVIALPGQADKALAALEMNPDFARWYDKDRSPLENYRKNRPVAALMAEWLEGQFAEQFEAVYQPYREKIAEIDKQVAAFEAEGISTKYLR